MTSVPPNQIQNGLNHSNHTGGGFYWRKENLVSIIPYQKQTTGKRVIQSTKDGKTIATYPSSKQAIKVTGILGINNCVIGLAKTAGGFIWRHV